MVCLFYYYYCWRKVEFWKKVKKNQVWCREGEVAEKSESLGASDDLFTSRNCMRGMNVALCACQTVGSNVRAGGRARASACARVFAQKEKERAKQPKAPGLQMSGAAPLSPGLHRQQAAVVRERQAALERLGGGQRAENKKEALSQPGMSFWIPTQCILWGPWRITFRFKVFLILASLGQLAPALQRSELTQGVLVMLRVQLEASKRNPNSCRPLSMASKGGDGDSKERRVFKYGKQFRRENTDCISIEGR